jgi:hypothetical protein
VPPSLEELENRVVFAAWPAGGSGREGEESRKQRTIAKLGKIAPVEEGRLRGGGIVDGPLG